ncbi:MAG TPA: DHA2 family efflux MFS transporter permease subunit [Streptosporangiaceae bacterium]|nr:DHA2 family efflux MFS transporter permease subunit [Streptosporangiaceae bacterium]
MAESDTRRWWALGALSLSVLVVALDLFVLTLALPTLSADLHASSGDLQWFVVSYSLVQAAALLPAGLLADKIGRKRILLGALVLFGLSSLACAYSTSSGELIAARAVLGLAGAVILPIALAVLPVMFTAEERPRAIAVVGGSTFLGYPIGPILGGWLLDHFWWGSVFLINVPVVVIALIAVTALMPESKGVSRFSLDTIGILISSAGLVLITFGVIRASNYGWSNAEAIATMVTGVVVLAAFVGWERLATRREQRKSSRVLPLVDLSLFNSAGFTWGTVLATLVSFALFGLVFAMPQYFLDVRGLDSLGAGIRMLPMIGGLAIGLGIGQRLQTPRKRRGSDDQQAAGPGVPLVSRKVIIAVGFAIMAVALAVGAGTTVASGTGFAAAWFAITGFGLGLSMPTALNIALDALSPERSGSGSALITAMRQVGGTIGVAVLGTVLATAYQSRLILTGLSSREATAIKNSVAGGVAAARTAKSARLLDVVRTAYVHGLDTMLWVCAGIAIVSAVLGLIFVPRWQAQAAQQTEGDDAAASEIASVS